ncbi:BnaC01g39040D [Brassica napus]|uniref:BnaC01g39040D protein n=1 Tax=Brassica napus TaxID=3708 RepID=A0A078GAW1_BRANA|nr:BnaC01g39040D [Brassica napus]
MLKSRTRTRSGISSPLVSIFIASTLLESLNLSSRLRSLAVRSKSESLNM